MRILLAQLNPTVGSLEKNADRIVGAFDQARKLGCDLVLSAELALTGYPPEDLLLLPDFVAECGKQLQRVILAAKGLTAVVGTVRPSGLGSGKPLHNSAAIIRDGRLLGFYDKRLLPTYDVFDERRYFEPGTESKAWELEGLNVGVTICEDVWRRSDAVVLADYKVDPVGLLAEQQLDLLLNLSASPYSFKKLHLRKGVVERAAKRCNCPAVLVNQVGGNDSIIFDGNSLVADAKGVIVAQGASFDEDYLIFDTKQAYEGVEEREDDLEMLYKALVRGLKDYFHKHNFKRALIGLSGGIDSSLVAVIAADALGPENVVGIAMPSRYSSAGSLSDASELAARLEIQCVTVPIEGPLIAFEELLGPLFEGRTPDVTEENLQARIRGLILMALSNKWGHIVLSTGNKSEMALGYATLYGDMAGGLAVISDVTKMQVYALCRWINTTRGETVPQSVIDKPPSAELRPDQKDSDSLPDYAVVDAVLEAYVEQHKPPQMIAAQCQVPLELVLDLLHRIHRNEYKRRQAPPGLRVTEKAFSVGRRFPIVQGYR